MNVKDIKLGEKINVYFYSLDRGTLEISVETLEGYFSELCLDSEGRIENVKIAVIDEDECIDFTILYEDLNHVKDGFIMYSLTNDENTLGLYKHALWNRACGQMKNINWKMTGLITEYNINKKIEEKFRIQELTEEEKQKQEEDLKLAESIVKSFSKKRGVFKKR